MMTTPAPFETTGQRPFGAEPCGAEGQPRVTCARAVARASVRVCQALHRRAALDTAPQHPWERTGRSEMVGQPKSLIYKAALSPPLGTIRHMSGPTISVFAFDSR